MTETTATDQATAVATETRTEGEGQNQNQRRSRDRYGRDRRERNERGDRGERADRGEREERAQSEAQESAAAATPAPAQQQAPASRALPVVQPYTLPQEDLAAIASGAGLQWVNSDADKVAAVQAAIAAEPKPVHVPRERPAPVVLDEGPLILVETRKDLGELKLPFEQASAAADTTTA